MKGITVPCPDCKGILFRNANFGNSGSLEMKCPHCQQLVKVNIEVKIKIDTFPIKTISAIIVIFIIFQFLIFRSLPDRISQGIKNALNEYVIETKD